MNSKIKTIISLLKKQHPDARIALVHKNALELLVSTILSAQCTDERVNLVTNKLFKKYKVAKDYASANLNVFEKEIYSTGFYKNKAKNIIAACQILDKNFNGEVPQNFDELLKLPGVARKTANCVMGGAFNVPSGIVVDTHVCRITQRLGLTKNTDPNKIEQDLLKIIPREEWITFSRRLIWHGRRVCEAKKPKCEMCLLNKLCPSNQS